MSPRRFLIFTVAAATSPFFSVLESGVDAQEARDLGSVRRSLEQAGVEIAFTYYGEVFANSSGGARQGVVYEGRLGTIIDADLEKLMGWSGARFHASTHQVHGRGLSENYVQNLMAVSGIEAPPTTRLFNLWVEQTLDKFTSVRIGQITAAQEFFVSQNANLFVNSTFGWPAITAQNLPSGGPSYPEATPGARLKVSPDDRFTFLTAIFNGDPAGPGPGNPVDRDPFGLAFRLRDPPFLIGEVAYAYNQTKRGHDTNPHQEGAAAPSANQANLGLPGTVKFGGWYHAERFADQRFDRQGFALADPLSSGQPRQHRGNWGLYAILDQMLWRAPDAIEDQGLSVFARGSGNPGDRNLIDLYVDAGLTYKGLIPGRPNDVAGAGFGLARISAQARASDRDVIAFSGVPMPIRDFEAVFEVTYQAQIAPNWSVQPTIQYIAHPGAHVPNPDDPGSGSAIANATVLGVRTVGKF